MESPHVLILPMPFQGHIMPLMEMAHHLVDAGFTVTFVNTEFNHHRLLSATAAGASTTSRLHLLGILDGMSSDEDRKDVGLICKLLPSGMSPGLQSVVRAAAVEGRPIQWILADQNMAWAFPMVKQMGLRAAVFWPASAAMIAIMYNIPKLIELGVISADGKKKKAQENLSFRIFIYLYQKEELSYPFFMLKGIPKKDEIFQLAAGMPGFHTTQLAWNMAGNSADKSAIFSYVMTNNRATADHSDFILCNTFMDLEPQAISLLPSAVPIGPLFPAKHHPLGHLWPPANSSTVLNWLDSHPLGSVVYVAFGSHAIFDKAQLDELAHGLEITGRPFLWALRPDLTTMGPDEVFPSGFLSRVKDRALVVGWAPQQLVLAHPSIGCFISHCGWNSTLEGVRNGVRFLCWPYFTDQFLNQSYICDTWRIGLRVGPDENREGEFCGNEVGVIRWERIRERVEEVMRDEEMRKRAFIWKEMALRSVDVGGSSYVNFNKIVDIMKTTT